MNLQQENTRIEIQMTPLIPAILSSASQLIVPTATAEAGVEGAMSFEKILNSALQSNNNSTALPKLADIANAASPTNPSDVKGDVKTLASKDDVSSLLTSNQVPSNTLSLADLFNALPSTTNNQNKLTTKELITKELITKELATKDPLSIISNSEESAKSTQTEINNQNNSDLINAQVMMAALAQSTPMVVPVSNQQINTSPLDAESANSVSSLGDQKISQQVSARIASLSNSSARSTSNNQSFNNILSDEVKNPTPGKVSESSATVGMTSEEIQQLLSDSKNKELVQQLAQIQTKARLSAEKSNDSALNQSTPSPADTPAISSIKTDTADQSFSFLNKGNSTELLKENNTPLQSNGSVAGVQFSDHLKQQSGTGFTQAITEPSSGQTLATPFHSPDWAPALHQRVTWMVRDQLQNATLTINPPHLGQIEVRLQTDQSQQTSVHFLSNNADVRQVINDNLSTLKEMMSQSGLQLGQADVGSRDSSQSAQYGPSSNKKSPQSNFPLPTLGSTEPSQGIGLINTFA
jgi:flagellar hook-length control protein FliK